MPQHPVAETIDRLVAQALEKQIQVHPESIKRATRLFAILYHFGVLHLFVSPIGMVGAEYQAPPLIVQVLVEQDRVYITLECQGVEEAVSFELTSESPDSLGTFFGSLSWRSSSANEKDDR